MSRLARKYLCSVEEKYSKEELQSAVETLSVSVHILWDLVQKGHYDARSPVGDETLNMAEVLKRIGMGPMVHPHNE